MKKITKKDIKDLEKRLAETEDSKRQTFLKATINNYSQQLGMRPPYSWAEQ